MEKAAVKSLVKIFLDGRKIYKKIFQLCNAAEIIDANNSQVACTIVGQIFLTAM